MLCLMIFHEKFGMVTRTEPGLLPEDLMKFRMKFLEEEFVEIQEAYEKGDVAGVADGLVDFVYVAMGTAELMGLPWDANFAEVHRANMTKRRAVAASESKRFSTYDVVKPPGWIGPDHNKIFEEFKQRGLTHDRRGTILRSGHQLP